MRMIVRPARAGLSARSVLARPVLASFRADFPNRVNHQTPRAQLCTSPRLFQNALKPEEQVHRELDEAHNAYEARIQDAIEHLVKQGYDRRTIWKQDLCWGDHDTFQHVNNVRYVRWYESARMKWGQVLAQHIDDEKRRNDILRGTGVSFILAGINVRYRRPLLYPDTVLVAQTIGLPITEDRFTISAIAYSVNQSTIASSADQLCVMYDYTKLKKCPIPEDLREVMEVTAQRTAANQDASTKKAASVS
ncbi:hypothetical protein OC845_000625 [Tilletia horrida]|nr:hypothetical protein OC845_000625 [Tilletia horrida]